MVVILENYSNHLKLNFQGTYGGFNQGKVWLKLILVLQIVITT